MYHPHIYPKTPVCKYVDGAGCSNCSLCQFETMGESGEAIKTVVQCISMLIEPDVLIVPCVSLRQWEKVEKPSDSHDIVDKADHCN